MKKSSVISAELWGNTLSCIVFFILYLIATDKISAMPEAENAYSTIHMAIFPYAKFFKRKSRVMSTLIVTGYLLISLNKKLKNNYIKTS